MAPGADGREVPILEPAQRSVGPSAVVHVMLPGSIAWILTVECVARRSAGHEADADREKGPALWRSEPPCRIGLAQSEGRRQCAARGQSGSIGPRCRRGEHG